MFNLYTNFCLISRAIARLTGDNYVPAPIPSSFSHEVNPKSGKQHFWGSFCLDVCLSSELAGGSQGHLAQGGVAVDAAGQQVDRGTGIHGGDHFLNEVGSMCAADVTAHNLACRVVDNHLEQTVGLVH